MSNFIKIGLELKRIFEALAEGNMLTLAEAHEFIMNIRVEDTNKVLKTLKDSTKRAWKVQNCDLMRYAIARALNLSLEEERPKRAKRASNASKIEKAGYYTGSAKKGFKSESGAKRARTMYLKKHNIAVHVGEYGIVQLDNGMYAIKLPTC